MPALERKRKTATGDLPVDIHTSNHVLLYFFLLFQTLSFVPIVNLLPQIHFIWSTEKQKKNKKIAQTVIFLRFDSENALRRAESNKINKC